jgi:hypothetical protein
MNPGIQRRTKEFKPPNIRCGIMLSGISARKR